MTMGAPRTSCYASLHASSYSPRTKRALFNPTRFTRKGPILPYSYCTRTSYPNMPFEIFHTDTQTYKLISPFCYSKYCLNNVDGFLTRLKGFNENLPAGVSIKKRSYDVESLFTKILLNRTIEKFLEKIGREN